MHQKQYRQNEWRKRVFFSKVLGILDYIKFDRLKIDKAHFFGMAGKHKMET